MHHLALSLGNRSATQGTEQLLTETCATSFKKFDESFQNDPGSGSLTGICGFSLHHQTWKPHLTIQVRRWVGPDWSHFVPLALSMGAQALQGEAVQTFCCRVLPWWEGRGVRALSPVECAAATVQRQCSGGSW